MKKCMPLLLLSEVHFWWFKTISHFLSICTCLSCIFMKLSCVVLNWSLKKDFIFVHIILFCHDSVSKLHTAELKLPSSKMSVESYNKAGSLKSTLDASLALDPGNKLLKYYIAQIMMKFPLRAEGQCPCAALLWKMNEWKQWRSQRLHDRISDDSESPRIRGSTERGWSVIHTDQAPRFGTQMMRGFIASLS